MEEMFLYLFAAYLVAGVLAAELHFVRPGEVPPAPGEAPRRGAGGPPSVRSALAGILLVLPLVPYAVVEARTLLFLPELRPAARAAVRGLLGDERVRSMKVLSRHGELARVYAVSPCGYPGGPHSGWRAVVVTLTRDQGRWRFEHDDDVVWSDCGSASGNIFPPYPGKGDYE